MKPKVKKVYARKNSKVISNSNKLVDSCQSKGDIGLSTNVIEVQETCEDLTIIEDIKEGTVKQLQTQSDIRNDAVVDILLVGDLVWSKIPGHSWWPSMISYDPNTAVYFKKSTRTSTAVKFHVQFFGDQSLRGWVSKSNIVRFQGRDHFVRLPASKLRSKKFVSQNHERSWNNAIIQAEQASLLDRRSRKLTYVFSYDNQENPDKVRKSGKEAFNSNKKTNKKVSKAADKCTDSRRSFRGNKIPQKCSDIETVVNTKCMSKNKEELASKPASEDQQKVPLTEKNLNSKQVLESENSSDSGIEDFETDLIASIGSFDIMEPLGSKRKRKQKLYEDFHTGDEIKEAMKMRLLMMEKPKRGRRSSKRNIKTDNFDSAISSADSDDISLRDNDVKQTFEIEKENVKSDSEESSSKLSRDDTHQTNPLLANAISENPKHKKYKSSQVKSNVSLKLQITSNTIEKTKGNIKDAEKSMKRKQGSIPVTTKLKKPKLESKVSVLSVNKNSLKVDDVSTLDKQTGNVDAVQDSSRAKRDPKDQYCVLCEETNGELLQCKGSCLNSFHADCLGLSSKPQKSFVCDECETGYHTCFSCKEAGDLIKCSQVCCGKFYHLHCIQKIAETKFEGKSRSKFFCPLHSCRYCAASKSSQMICNGKKLLKCIRCPTAYHQSTCLIAGCVILSQHNMICDNHFVLDKTKKNHTHVNVTWCFVCSVGGSLVCCDTCPASFHPGCTENLTGIPEGSWQCQDCRDHKKPRYGDVVWVKFGVYRWWPAQICYPDEIPERILNLTHSLCEFPVMFFGSRDYAWLHSGRVFKYEEGDKGGNLNGNVSLAKYFKKAIEEAKEAYNECMKKREQEAEFLGKKKSNKPPPFKNIKTNRPVSCIRTILDQTEWPVCECKPSDPCNGESECLNRMLLFECSPKTCPAEEKCCNQRMQKCEYVKCKPVKCEGRGWGLRAEQEIKSGDFAIEYVGELIDEETCHKRIKQYHEQDIYDYYFLTIDRDNIIDAYPKANLSRFMNHSCDPNCETQKWTVNGEVRVGLFANRDIAIGDELCFNYNLDCLGNEKKECKCGSANCSGYLGVQPKTQHAMSVAEKAKNKMLKDKEKRKMKRQKIKLQKTVHEDDCFICGDGGELILCSRAKCTKSYHVSCLKLESTPRGKWQCPWHFCDECGKLAKAMCALCPNSFCDAHKECELVVLQEGLHVCVDHASKEITEFMSKYNQMAENNASDISQDEGNQGRSTEKKLDANVDLEPQNVDMECEKKAKKISNTKLKEKKETEKKPKMSKIVHRKSKAKVTVTKKDEKKKDVRVKQTNKEKAVGVKPKLKNRGKAEEGL